MTFVSPTSPLTEAVAQVLEVFRPGQVARKRPEDEKEYLVISFREDFDFLWQLDTTILSWLEAGPRTIALIWDETPPEVSVRLVNTADYVTAFDWAVALSLAVDPGRQGRPTASIQLPSWRLLLIDFASGHHLSSESVHLFQRLQQGTPPILPWVSVYRPNNLVKFTLDAIQGSLAPQLDIQQMGLLRQLWAAILSKPARPDDHHAIANLVGPLLLLSGMGEEGPFRWAGLHTPALRTLLNVVGLLPKPGSRPILAPWFVRGMLTSQQLEAVSRGLDVLVLDDLCEMGWGDFVTRALGCKDGAGSEDLQIHCVSNAAGQAFGDGGDSALVEILEDRLSSQQGIDATAHLRLLGTRPNLLLLDLRLFSTRSPDEEAAFLGKLLELAKKISISGSKIRLPWPAFGRRELQDIEAVIRDPRSLREAPGYLAALTLLPRLLALADPTLPIVLFSSTGQRSIIEKLAPYRSIITTFEKPRFFGHATESIIADMRANFSAAMKQALDIAYSRLVCERIVGDSLHPTAPISTTNDAFVEIYIDESGSSRETFFRVGGLVLIYPNESVADNFNKALVQSGLTIGVDQDLVNPGSGGMTIDENDLTIQYEHNLSKRPSDPFTEALDPFDRLCSQHNVRRVAVALFRASRLNRRAHPLLDPEALDNLYRSLLKSALEVILFELLPHLCPGTTPKVFVYVATRLRDKGTISSQTWEGWSQHFGVRMGKFPGGDNFFYSVSGDDVYPIVVEVLERRPKKSSERFVIVGARGTELLDLDKLKDRYNRVKSDPQELSKLKSKLGYDGPRQAHYYADLVIHCASQPAIANNSIFIQWKKSWFEDGFWDVVDDRFEAAIDACRHQDAGRHVEAILAGHRAGLSGSVFLTGVARWARVRLAESVRKLSGSEFIELCERLARASGP